MLTSIYPVVSKLFERSAEIVGILTVIWVLTGGTAQAAPPIKVDCDNGGSIQSVLDEANVGDKVKIKVQGNCIEDVEIKLDDVSIKGQNPDGGTVTGELSIIGAQRVVIQNMTITGPGNGIVATQNAAFTLRNSHVNENEEWGIGLFSATARIENTEIRQNLSAGINVDTGGVVNLKGTMMIDNDLALLAGANLEITRGRAELEGGGNFIKGAVGAFDASSFNAFGNFTGDPAFVRDVIEVEPGENAVFFGRQSVGNLREIDIRGSVRVQENSTLFLRTSEITGTLDVRRMGVVTGDRENEVNSISCSEGGVVFGTPPTTVPPFAWVASCP